MRANVMDGTNYTQCGRSQAADDDDDGNII